VKVDGVQCDVCTKFFNTQTTYLPRDWFTLTRGNEELHFCCLGHLREWIDKQLDVKEIGDTE
jgi:hypothetical protein